MVDELVRNLVGAEELRAEYLGDVVGIPFERDDMTGVRVANGSVWRYSASPGTSLRGSRKWTPYWENPFSAWFMG